MATYTQANRPLAVSSSLGQDALLLQGMRGHERLGRMFAYELELLSEDGLLALQDVLCEPMTVRLDLPEGGQRFFHGFVSRFCQAGAAGRLFRYRATLRPWLWFLTRRADCRIFQNMTAPDIIKDVFRQEGFSDFEDALSGTYASLEYCVQYRETHFNFVSRLMEREGIYYYFKHEEGKHTLVLADAYSSHQTAPGFAQVPYFPPDAHGSKPDHLDDWQVWQEAQPGNYALNDFDYLNPKANLHVNAAGPAHGALGSAEIYDYPGEYVKTPEGETYARLRIEELHALAEQAQGRGNARGLAAGNLFALIDFPRNDQNREYLIVAADYEMQSDEFETEKTGAPALAYRCSVSAIASETPYRAPRVTPKPFVQGLQSAIVVGKSGEEIWTDEHGRVKVQFPWDRYGKSDENSSCWVRVAHLWAGNKWGALYLPRIGQEVLVDFLEGDPDRPIVVGRVYNGEQRTPLALPADKTQSTLRSRSSKQGNEQTFNELRFEDKKGEEHIYFHAEKDFERVVENNDVLKVGFDKKDKGDQTITIFNNQSLTVGNANAEDGSQTIQVWKNRSLTVKEADETIVIEKGNRKLDVVKGDATINVGNTRKTTIAKGETFEVTQGNRDSKIGGNDTLTIEKGGNLTIKVAQGEALIEAVKAITLKVGGSSIKIEPAKITLAAPQIAIQAQAQAELKGAMVKVAGDAMAEVQSPMTKVAGSGMAQIQGGIVMIN